MPAPASGRGPGPAPECDPAAPDELGDLLLGVDPTAARRESTLPLRPGAVVLLYTDGLVERRDRDVDTGMARLRRHLAALADRPLEQLADELRARMLPATPGDDVALVTIWVLACDRPGPTPGASAAERRKPPRNG